MSKRYKASFICYLLVALVLYGFGLRYLLAGELTPYHAAAPGQSLEAMTPNQQITFLLLGPFRRGEVWSRWPASVASLVSVVLAHGLATGKAKV